MGASCSRGRVVAYAPPALPLAEAVTAAAEQQHVATPRPPPAALVRASRSREPSAASLPTLEELEDDAAAAAAAASPPVSARRMGVFSVSTPALSERRAATPPAGAVSRSASDGALAWHYITVKVRPAGVVDDRKRRIAYVYSGDAEAGRSAEADGVEGELHARVAVPAQQSRFWRADGTPTPPPPLVHVVCGSSPPAVLHADVARRHGAACSAIVPPCTVAPLCVLWGPDDLALRHGDRTAAVAARAARCALAAAKRAEALL
jgi:hypothetical protein